MHVTPLTQLPDPVHPIPPHCAYFAKLPLAAAVLVVVGADEVLLVDSVVFVPAGAVELRDVVVPPVPDPTPAGPVTEVVSEPLSM